MQRWEILNIRVDSSYRIDFYPSELVDMLAMRDKYKAHHYDEPSLEFEKDSDLRPALIDIVGNLGLEGWEPVGLNNSGYLFKRPIED